MTGNTNDTTTNTDNSTNDTTTNTDKSTNVETRGDKNTIATRQGSGMGDQKNSGGQNIGQMHGDNNTGFNLAPTNSGDGK